MSSFRCRNLSYLVFALAAACGDGDSVATVGTPAEINPGEDAIVQQDNDKDQDEDTDQEEKVAVEPDAIGLPCEIKSFLTMHCQGCHGAEAKNGTPLLTRENLQAAAKKDPELMVAERAALRMVDAEKPMPPAAKNDRINSDDLAVWMKYLDDGMPAGRCDEPPAAP